MPALLKKYQTREDGFTLIELLIVVLIIGVLAAIAIPVYLGIQQQAYKSSVKADVNTSVKRVQVAITEGASVSDIKASPSTYTQKSVKGESMYIAASSTAGASANDFALSGVVNTSTTPAGPINFAYTYDSVTGNFTESSSGLAFGSANPTITITTGSLASAVTGNAYSQTLSAATTSPTAATSWSATGLPTGWTIDPSTGTIAATAANVNTTGSYNVSVTATNGSVNDSHAYTLLVKSTPTFTTTTLPDVTSGSAYNATVVANGYPAPTFTATGLPTGLNISSAGVISGTTTQTGTFSPVITASNGTTDKTQTFGLNVTAAPVITTTSLPTGIINQNYNQTINATGSPSPTFTLQSGSLPNGLNLNASTGVISGTPTTSGSATFTVKANNTAGNTTQSYTLTVNGALATPSVSLSRFVGRNSVVSWNAVPNATSYQVTYSGAYSGTYTTTATSYQQALPISTGITNVTATVTAINSSYVNSAGGSTNISVPGSRMNAGAGFSNCTRDSSGIDMNVGSCGIVSTDGTWVTVSQQDGNFVEYKTDINNISYTRAYYATNIVGNYYTSMQTDTNLVTYAVGGPAARATGTNLGNNSNGYLVMQGDGNLALYSNSGQYQWGTTGGTSFNPNYMVYVGP